jgi:glycosyltransferase involved in cell wall biosynthesis
MKKKIFLIVGSLGAGGAERVYWLLSQYFSRAAYNVTVVFLNGNDTCYSTQIEGVNFIDLKTVKASRSFFKLYKLLKQEKPYAVFSTSDHINILTAMVSMFLPIPVLVARLANNVKEMKSFYGLKARLYFSLNPVFLTRCKYIVCQTEEMQRSFMQAHRFGSSKMKIISNPVLQTLITKQNGAYSEQKKLVSVARLSEEKGLFRLIDIMEKLPRNYTLTIAGSGPLQVALENEIRTRHLENNISLVGQVNDIPNLIVQHDVMVMSSYTEGFPNALLEALSVGVPVVSFKVGGTKELIRDGMNGFVVEQNNIEQFKNLVVEACSQQWDHKLIKADAYRRFNLDRIGQAYEQLLYS